MSNLVPVQPALAPIIKYVRISIYQLILGEGFKCVCQLLDEDKITIVTKELIIDGDDYNNWVSDEEMTNLILSKLGLLPKPSPPIPSIIDEEPIEVVQPIQSNDL